MPSTKPLTTKELTKAQKELSVFTATPKATKLSATFTFKDHISALVFIARVTVHAEVMQHHPDITYTYAQVKVNLTTHDAKGITSKDIKLAKKIETLCQK